MRLLPSEQKSRIEAAKKEFEETGKLCIDEPCDCGGQVRHNNGGNYHEEVELRRDSGKVFVKFGSTSDYDQSEWEECENWQAVIEERSDWL